MSDLDEEYQDRIRELDQASSPTLRQEITSPPAAGQETPGGGEAQQPPELTTETVGQMLRSFGPPTQDQMREKSVQEFGQAEKQKPTPETQAVLDKPEWRKVLDRALKAMTGVTSDEIQKAIEEGTLDRLVAPTALKTADPFGNAASIVAESTAEGSGLDPQAVKEITGATTFFAGLLFPGFKGSKAAKEVAGAAAAARAAGATEKAVASSKRLIRVGEVSTETARNLARDSGDLVIGNRALKMDWAGVDTTGELDRILNRAADVVHEEWVDAKRGVIKDSQLARMAEQKGIDVTQLLGRRTGEIFNVEKQMAAQMVMGQLGLRMKQLAKQMEVAPAAAIEDEMRRTGALLLAVVPQVRASTSEAGRVVRIAGVKIPGVQEAGRQAEMLQLMATKEGELAQGLPMAEVARQLNTLDTPEQVSAYFKVLRGLAGGIVGAGLGAEGGESVGGTAGAVAGGVLGGALGATGAINPAVLMEAWINGLLSGSQTYVVNVLSEMASTVNGVLERGLAATHGSTGSPVKVVPGEATVMLHAGMGYLWRSSLAYGKVLASEPGWTAARAALGAAGGAAISSDDSLVPNTIMGAAVGALVRPGSFLLNDKDLTQRALSAEGLGLSGPLGRAADVTGAYLRAPSRGLVQADNYIKAMNVEMEMWALAHRGATLKGYEAGSADYRNFVLGALESPSSETLMQAQDYAAYIAFQSETNRAIAGVTAGNPLLRVIAPFTFTPSNILSMSFERMPLIQYASAALREDLAAGGAREQLARAKIDMGIAMTGMAWYLAASGVTHGHGMVNPILNKQQRELQKIQPYSFTVPGTDKNASFNRMDPWAMHFGLVATIYEISHELPDENWKQLLGAVVVGGVDQWLQKSYLQGIAGFTDAMTEARAGKFKSFEKFMEGLAGSTVPTGVATLERALDPKLRQVDSMTDAIRARLPGFSESQPQRLDFFADPIEVPHVGYEVLDMLNPFYVQEPVEDLKKKFVADEFQKKKIDVTGPSRRMGPGPVEQDVDLEGSVGPKAIHLTDEQYEKLQRLFGKTVRVNGLTLKDGLYAAMHSQIYTSIGPIGQQTYIKGLVQQYKAEAKGAFLASEHAVRARLNAIQKQQMDMTLRPQTPKTPDANGILQNLLSHIGR